MFWPRTYSHPYFAGFIHHPLIIHSPIRALRFTVLIHLKIQSIYVSARILPPLLPIPQVTVIISKSRNMKSSISHSPSHFLLIDRLCCPYIGSPFPCSHPLRIVVSTILGSDFLHPLHPTVAPFYFAISTFTVHQPRTPISSTQQYPPSPFPQVPMYGSLSGSLSSLRPPLRYRSLDNTHVQNVQ